MTGARGPAVHSLAIACPACGQTSTHRILHVSGYSEGSSLSGIARCGECHAVHPFEVKLAKARVKTIVSDASVSRRVELEMEPDRRLHIEDCLEETERKYIVTRIETRDARSARDALAKDVRTLWVLPGDLVRVKVSVTTGSFTTPALLTLAPEAPLRVGDRVSLTGGSVIVSALRVADRTLDEPGDGATAREVRRVYAYPAPRTYRRPAGIDRSAGPRYRTGLRPVGSGARRRGAVPGRARD